MPEFDPTSLIAPGIGAVTGIIQSLIGGGQAKRANERRSRLFSQRKAYQTPDEVFQLLNLSQMNASQGFSDETLGFLEGSAGSGLASTLGTATKLGADPNQLSGVLDSFYQNIFKIGTENELVKMKKFDDFSKALQLVAQNQEAEQISADNLLKDQLQAEGANVQAGQTNVSSGLNLAFQSIMAALSSNLYGENGSRRPKAPAGVDTSAYTATTPGSPVKINLGTIPTIPKPVLNF